MSKSIPDKSWSLSRLGQYIRSGLADADRLRERATQLSRRSAVQIHRAGRALDIARQKTKPKGQWSKWLAKNKIPRSTAWESIRLFQAASEEDVATLTITEAKIKFDIYAELMPDEDTQRQAANRRSAAPEHQLASLGKKLDDVVEMMDAIEWDRDVLFSLESDELLANCKKVVREFNRLRKTTRQPRKVSTKKHLQQLRAL